MNQSEIEMYHDSGKMSDKYYYQQNKKSAQHNYNEQRRRIMKRYKQKKSFEDYIFDMFKAMSESALKEIFNTLNELS